MLNSFIRKVVWHIVERVEISSSFPCIFGQYCRTMTVSLNIFDAMYAGLTQLNDYCIELNFPKTYLTPSIDWQILKLLYVHILT